MVLKRVAKDVVKLPSRAMVTKKLARVLKKDPLLIGLLIHKLGYQNTTTVRNWIARGVPAYKLVEVNAQLDRLSK